MTDRPSDEVDGAGEVSCEHCREGTGRESRRPAIQGVIGGEMPQQEFPEVRIARTATTFSEREIETHLVEAVRGLQVT